MKTMPLRTEPNLPTHPVGSKDGRAPGWWGMVFLIFTEGTFFAILLLSYFYLRFQHGPGWPPDGIKKPDLGLILVMTPILILSSIPMHIADSGIRKGKVGRLRFGLALTLVQGATFLVLQVVEYHTKLMEFTPKTDAYGSIFYTITGFHGIHVFVGLCLITWLLVYAFRGRWTEDNHVAVQNIALYWHFVDAVWLFILTSLYLSPHFFPS
ncbi:MAG TPA: heme-copper oxidase subunit III [Actinobacteria bacterium]|jgi:heme/copper-type cytochrome/quinol oxidase subunit 3|nr:heme-copper oxidase subunit III [Actinomycetota bacterium]HCP62086.1 heme-copper oxidase subunit III [Actinomycetota bacterium]